MRQLAGAWTIRRHVDTEQGKVALLIHREQSGNGKHFAFAIKRLDFAPLSSSHNMKIGDNLSGAHEESAACHQRLALRIVSRNCNYRGLTPLTRSGRTPWGNYLLEVKRPTVKSSNWGKMRLYIAIVNLPLAVLNDGEPERACPAFRSGFELLVE